MTISPALLLRSKLERGTVFGTFVKLGRREVVDILARAGFDFAICDLEHSQISEQEASQMIVAGMACQLPLIVRVAGLEAGLINRLLEAGAAGIQLPQVRTRNDVDEFRGAMKYPPQGSRSISLAQPAAGYGGEALGDYMQRSNDEALLVGQLETREVERPLDRLIQGLDVAFAGILDLTADMGVPGMTTDSAVVERLKDIESAAAKARVHPGIYADSPARALQAAAAGYRYVAVNSDLGALMTTSREWVRQLQQSPASKA